MQMITDFPGIADHHRVFCHGPDDVDDVDFLVAQLAELQLRARGNGGFLLDLAGNIDGGNGIEPLPDNAGQRIGSARSTSDNNGSHTARSPGVPFGRHRAGLLVMAADIVQIRMPANRIDQMHGSAAGDHKCLPDAVLHQRFHDIVADFDRSQFCFHIADCS